MTLDLSEQLRGAAGPLPELDEATFQRLSRQRRRSGDAVVVLAIAVLIAMVTAAWLVTRTGSDVQFTPADGSSAVPEPAGPADIAAGLVDVEWEVLAVGVSHVWSVVGRVATDQAGLDRLWQAFEADGSAPRLPSGRGAVVLPLAGTCDRVAQVHGLEGILNADGTRAHAAVQVDPTCASELPGRGSVHPPPHTLYVIAVPVEVAERLAGVVAVVGRVADFDWEILSVGATPYAPADLVVSDEARGLDSDWRRLDMPGSPPTLSAAHGALLVSVPGSCDDPDEVQAVRAFATEEDHQPLLSAVYFDPSCAEPLREDQSPPTPGTLYVIAIPLEVAKSVGGALAFIACPGSPATQTLECADPTDRAVPVDDPSRFGS